MKVGRSDSKYIAHEEHVELKVGEELFLCRTCNNKFALLKEGDVYKFKRSDWVQTFSKPRCTNCASSEVVSYVK
jgi:hypothetical protein